MYTWNIRNTFIYICYCNQWKTHWNKCVKYHKKKLFQSKLTFQKLLLDMFLITILFEQSLYRKSQVKQFLEVYDSSLKSSYDILSAVDDFFVFTNGIQALQHWWKKYMDCKGRLCWKVNPIYSHFMSVFWLAYELFSQHSYILAQSAGPVEYTDCFSAEG